MRSALLIDGGYLRASAKSAGRQYDNTFIESFAKKCLTSDESLLRTFYYDSPQFRGTVKLPVSGKDTRFKANDQWLNELAQIERFAVRRGTIGFRGWTPKNIPIAGRELTDEDFAPSFEQKGVDMRIGLDIASFAELRTVGRIILVSGDSDMIPAMKHARKAGLEIVSVQLPSPTKQLHPTLVEHSDLIRAVTWP